MAVAIAVRRSTPLHWLHRLSRPKTPLAPRAPRAVQPPAAYAANVDRWATLPGEYDTCDPMPMCATLAPLDHPGVSEPVACAVGGLTVLHLGGAWRGHVAFEGSSDGRIWRPITLLPLMDEASTEATRPGTWRTTPDTVVSVLRVRVIGLVAGTILPAIAQMPSGSAATNDADIAA